MRRRDLLSMLVRAAATSRPLAGAAQQKRTPVVGYLALVSPGPFAPMLASFHKGLAEAGYVEGQNVSLEYRWAEGRQDKLAALAAELVARNVDVITTHGGAVTARVARSA